VATAKSTLREAFSRVLRSLRQEAGISQEELAHRSGLHRTYISQLERGLKSPSLDALESLARALEQRPHLLIKAAEDSLQ
jgi:transcriptional regulator with XRE-family HTH domain